MPRYRQVAGLLLALLALLAACAGGHRVSTPGADVAHDQRLIALEAYRGEEQYFLRYRRGEDIFYTTGRLRSQVPGAENADLAAFDGPRLAPMESEREKAWRDLTIDLAPVPVLGKEDWARFRDVIFAEFLPTEANSGVTVSFDRADFFFFYDARGRFRARRLIDKPRDYKVAAHVDLQQYFDRWQPALDRFLAERGIHSREVLFNTGNLERGGLPFVYINTRTRLVVLVQYNEIRGSMPEAIPGSHVLMSLWHFMESHTYAVPLRPFSSVQSLLAVTSDTALESGRKLLTGVTAHAPPPVVTEGPGMDLAHWERELDQRLGRPASLGRLDFLVGGEQFFTRFVDVVASAEKTVNLRAYIFDNDDVALSIAELLKRRSNEGVKVRVLFDGLGTAFSAGERSASLPENLSEPLSIHQWLEQDSRVAVRKVKNFLLTGDHVKTMVIDKRLAFLGGMNIGREYRYDWHDLMVEVSGPVVDEINNQFSDAWARAGLFGDFGALFNLADSSVNRSLPGYPVRLIYTEPGRQEIYTLQREAIRQARRYIYIENAYFTDDSLLKELILARRRGVDVRVIIPLETDNGAITRNIALAANTLLENGVRVFIYPGFTHAKAAVFDGWASVGSANLDRLSLRLNRELNITTSEPEAVQELLAELFEPDFAAARELTRPFPERWTDRLIEMFGDYIF